MVLRRVECILLINKNRFNCEIDVYENKNGDPN